MINMYETVKLTGQIKVLGGTIEDLITALGGYQTQVNNINTATTKLTKTQKALGKATGITGEYIVKSGKVVDKFGKSIALTADTLDDLGKTTQGITRGQRALGIVVNDGGKYFTSSGQTVDKYGLAISKTGENLGNFNKRSAILNTTIQSFTKDKKPVTFWQGYAKYVELGGSRLEYFAEYLSSTREELTFLGLETAKVRKFMYGFLPPGMFRMVNKLSSSFQFFGGTMRKLKDNGKSAGKEMDRLIEAINSGDLDATEMAYAVEQVEKLAKERPPPSIIGHLINGFGKMKGVASKAGMAIDKMYGGLAPDTSKDAEKGLNQYGEETKKTKLGITKLGIAAGHWFKIQRKIYKGTRQGVFFSTKKLAKDMKMVAKGIPKYIASPSIALREDWEKTKDFVSKNSLYQTFVEEKGDLKKMFADGFDVSQVMADNQAQIDKFNMDEINEEMNKINKQLENSQAIENQMAALKASIKPLKYSNEANDALKEELAYLENISNRKEELQNAADKHLKLTKAQQTLEAQSMGSVILKKQIDASIEAIKQAEERQKLIPDEIKQRQAALKVLQAEKQVLTKAEDAAKGKKKGALQRQIKAKKKEISTTKVDITGLKTEQENAPIKIEENKNTIKGNKEQLKLLRQAKKDSFANLMNKHPTIAKISKVMKGIGGIIPALGGVLRFAAASMVYVMLAIVGIVILLKVFGPMIKDAFNKAMEFIEPMIPKITKIVEDIVSNLTSIFNSIFGDGGIEQLIDGFVDLAVNLLKLSLTLALTGLGLLASFTWELLKLLWAGAVKYVKDILKDGKKMAKAIIMVVAVIGTIAALIMGAPLWIAVVIGVVIWKMGSKLLVPITWATNLIVKVITWIKDQFNKLPFMAEGGVAKGGMTVVGEEGPELVKLPKGARVFSNEESKEISTRKGKNTIIGIEQKKQNIQNHTNNINITINAKDTSKAEMDRIAREISRTIQNNISRQNNSLR